MILIKALIVLCCCVQPQIDFSAQEPSKPAAGSQERIFKVSGLPFDINGLHLQYQYTIKVDGAENPKRPLLLDKKLVDIRSQTVVCNFKLILVDEKFPVINLTDIDRVGYRGEEFKDVNFDDYKDIREPCEPCSGTLGNIETIYLFDSSKRKFAKWQAGMGINVEVDKENRTVRSLTGRPADGGEFHYKEIKFADHGIELYLKKIDCILFDEKKRAFKVVYYKYQSKKLVVHKTRIIYHAENVDPQATIENIEK